MWARGPRVWSTGGPRFRYARCLAIRLLGAVHGLSTRLCSGRSAGMRTRPHIHRLASPWMQTHWLRTHTADCDGGSLLRCVDWVPPDFTTSRSWPFSMSRDRRPGCPFGDSPESRRFSPVTRVLHTGRVCPESMCLFLFPVLSCPVRSIRLQYALGSRRLSPAAAPDAASHGARCPR